MMAKARKKPAKATSSAAKKKVCVPQKGRSRYEILEARKDRSKKAIVKKHELVETLEEAYRRKLDAELSGTKINHLLPIKVKGKGLVTRTAPKNGPSESTEREISTCGSANDEHPTHSTDDTTFNTGNPQKVLTLAEILLKRNQEVREKQLSIGSQSAAILETPDARIDNLNTLLDYIRAVRKDGGINLLAVRKTAIISLAEIFRDIVPEFRIGIVNKEEQKLKKDTLARVNFENKLLSYYKQYLKELECITNSYHRCLRQSKKMAIDTTQLLQTCVQCMCDLVLAHPYFNYSPNIVQVLVLMLNDVKENIRKIVHSCFATLFKTDIRLDLTYHTVRHINQLLKKKERHVHPEMISCLKFLQIHRINLHDDTLLELKKQKLEKQKSRIINMSRKERKRKKKLQELEKDIFETKAEESKQIVRQKLTNISKLAFMIVFKILKCYPDSRVLSVTLEVLSKFAHTINIDFFADLVELLNNLLENAELGYRDHLHCIQTVFTILGGQGEVLNIDPARFYSHFYKNLLYVHGGKNHGDMKTILNTLDILLFKRRRNVTSQRYLSFLKRLATLSLQTLPNGSLGLIAIIRSSLQMNQHLDILLNTDEVIGSGTFDPLNDEPEFANANCTSLFETTCLARHFHPTIRKVIPHLFLATENRITYMARALTPSEWYANYDCSEVIFNPEITPPAKLKNTKEIRSHLGIASVKERFLVDCATEHSHVKYEKLDTNYPLAFDYFAEYL
ncbi:nucleolar complex protein 3 homolog [Anopheles aquasalis]|uniref:nucleolar complex protein 3 homolog n=1 Tax=Anopheles aquasalis TaxID=42839 RepID=UPI00215A4BF1|nr:nucleolar complex protein 3 homolog [Anopheles aquasalis]XP_050099880.1 nucleolar complex protein 3 homolog [Anopheles aquasalis]XP_050099881.1 nucleolar complex protein 3 homolog [Anopheles aquasalis]